MVFWVHFPIREFLLTYLKGLEIAPDAKQEASQRWAQVIPRSRRWGSLQAPTTITLQALAPFFALLSAHPLQIITIPFEPPRCLLHLFPVLLTSMPDLLRTIFHLTRSQETFSPHRDSLARRELASTQPCPPPPPEYTSRQAIPEITGKQGSQPKTKSSNPHRVAKQLETHGEKQREREGERWGSITYLGQGTSRQKDRTA